MTALLAHYGHWYSRLAADPQASSHASLVPRPELCYAQVIKTTGAAAWSPYATTWCLGPWPESIGCWPPPAGRSTAFIERVNLTIRQHVAAVGRRVMTLCKHEDAYAAVGVVSCLYNFCLPTPPCADPCRSPSHHGRLGQRWQPGRRRWRLKLTDHVWTLRECSCSACRVPQPVSL